MLRKAFPNNTEKNGFRMRGHEIRRIETFSDGVFAFAVTLLIVSLEVPNTFQELIITMRGFFAFGISFFILMQIWNEQNIFFRRYGLDDNATHRLNGILIFIVLFYVYPLKFLFTLLFSNQIYAGAHNPFVITDAQMPYLMMIYGAGFVIIYFIFFMMYAHAYKNRKALELNAIETFDTRTKIFAQLILIGIAAFSILLALVLPLDYTGVSGLAYLLIGPGLSIFYSVRGRQRRMHLEKTN
jgi:uncharacterized membrane protein